jgi:hypothetical protein
MHTSRHTADACLWEEVTGLGIPGSRAITLGITRDDVITWPNTSSTREWFAENNRRQCRNYCQGQCHVVKQAPRSMSRGDTIPKVNVTWWNKHQGQCHAVIRSPRTMSRGDTSASTAALFVYVLNCFVWNETKGNWTHQSVLWLGFR